MVWQRNFCSKTPCILNSSLYSKFIFRCVPFVFLLNIVVITDIGTNWLKSLGAQWFSADDLSLFFRQLFSQISWTNLFEFCIFFFSYECSRAFMQFSFSEFLLCLWGNTFFQKNCVLDGQFHFWSVIFCCILGKLFKEIDLRLVTFVVSRKQWEAHLVRKYILFRWLSSLLKFFQWNKLSPLSKVNRSWKISWSVSVTTSLRDRILEEGIIVSVKLQKVFFFFFCIWYGILSYETEKLRHSNQFIDRVFSIALWFHNVSRDKLFNLWTV